MCLIKMESLSIIQPLNRWEYDSIRPGNVGSVGDCLMSVELKTSNPDLPARYQEIQPLKKMGSVVGGIPETKGGFWGMRRDFKTDIGWIKQDFVSQTTTIPLMGGTPQYLQRNRIATVYEAKRTGNNFLPLPNGYKPGIGQLTRGGQSVRVTNIEGFEPLMIEGSAEQVLQNQWDSLGNLIKKSNNVSFSKSGVKKAKLKK